MQQETETLSLEECMCGRFPYTPTLVYQQIHTRGTHKHIHTWSQMNKQKQVHDL